MSPRYRDAYAVGLARGWELANHAEHMEHRVIIDAEAEADAVEVPLSYAEGDARSGWTTGYRDGIDAYHAAEHLRRAHQTTLSPGSAGWSR